MVRIGFVGIGYWGPNLLRNFASMKNDVEIGCICDKDKSRLESMKGSFPAARLTDDYDVMLKDKAIDAVVLAHPAALHYQFAKKALEAGKDIFVEKPLAMNVRECEDLIATADKNKKIIFVGHTFLYNSAVREVKKYIDNGEIGGVYYIYSQRLNLGKVRSDVDVVWNLAPHDISIIMYLLGEKPVSVSAHGFYHLRKDIADVGFIILAFKNGSSAHIHVSWLDPNKIRRLTVVGSKKMIVYDDVDEDSKIKIYDKGIDKHTMDKSLGAYDRYEEFLFKHRSGDIFVPRLEFEEPLRVETRHFIDCVKGRKGPVTDGINGLEVVKVLEAASLSMKSGKEVKL